MKEVILTRKELYDLAWSSPISLISKRYIISYNELRKISYNLNIPLPKAGHWKKLEAGKSVTIEELPVSHSKHNEIKLLLREEGDENYLSPIDALKKEIESNPKLPLTVPAKLSNPHKLIVEARNYLKDQDDRFGRYIGIVGCHQNHFDISVTLKNLDRALRFLDTLIKLFHARGHDIKIKNSSTYAIVYGEEIKISLKEKTKRVIVKDDRWERSEYHPSGILSFKMEIFYNDTEWKDGTMLIEEQLSKILARMEIKAKEHKEQQRIWEIDRQEQAEKDRIKREIREREEKELADFKELIKDANRWRQAEILKDYIDAMEKRITSNHAVSVELKDWITWARKKVDWYHPHINSEDELLKEVEKDSLTFKRKSNFYL
jgi:hypothetical protein